MNLRSYIRGLAVLADDERDQMQKRCDMLRDYVESIGATGDDYGPLSPEDLAKLDRKLTPAEQAAVDEWQAKQAEAQLAAVRKTSGPRTATVSVTKEGAVIERPKVVQKVVENKVSIAWWQYALGSIGVVAVGVGVYQITRKKK